MGPPSTHTDEAGMVFNAKAQSPGHFNRHRGKGTGEMHLLLPLYTTINLKNAHSLVEPYNMSASSLGLAHNMHCNACTKCQPLLLTSVNVVSCCITD